MRGVRLGRFTVPLRFGTVAAGPRVVTADCGTGAVLTTQLDVVLASSTGGTARTHVLLLFFLLVGSLAIRWQFAAAYHQP